MGFSLLSATSSFVLVNSLLVKMLTAKSCLNATMEINRLAGSVHGAAYDRLTSEPLRLRFRERGKRCRFRREFHGFMGPRISKLSRIETKAPGVMGATDGIIADAIELQDATAFQLLATGGGLISIAGFGSLLSEKSARQTFPKLLNFRVAVLHGFRRVFGHVAPVFLERGIANVESKEMSSLSVEPCPGESIIVTVFEISQSEVPAFIEREHEFRFLGVTVYSPEGESFSHKVVICARYSDEEYRRDRCKGDDEYHERYGKYGIHQIWRDDILPCRVYLRHCVLASQNLSQAAYDSFLDHTFLGNRTTTIRQHLAANKEIMLELPPPILRDRYGG